MTKKLLILFIAFFGYSSLMANSINGYNNLLAQRTTKVIETKPVIFEINGMQFTIIMNESARFLRLNIKHLYNTDKSKPIGITLKTDKKGRINFANDTPIVYNSRGKIIKIGTIVFLYKNGNLAKIGQLEIIQNPEGGLSFKGHVRGASKTYFTKKPKIKMS